MIIYLPGTTVSEGAYMHGYITLTNEYCGSLALPLVAVKTGTEENPAVSAKPAFRVYPNPTAGTFTIEQQNDRTIENLKVEIYSMLGKRIMSDDVIGEKKHQFILGDVPTGIYLVRIMAGEKVETIKLIKQ
ncbi:MAG: T9SS type A sorting domain-containing protein [Bacteroidetes bacterium]|nr:T9SS type A sorting domain-containing protein [Bacteroidota bacterium]